ncbi:uncharacterized protein EAF02_004801 [Botrytis sinoallii]|uniref:uncharacterized protein n=1 Tax=Botrytis sinoallii TaxID=1463999 RepID=UPI001901D6C7|nr:uncharacterized protein EAF02_004801 [Botrytis sinoallii]KAF7884465.1 hypothetical protein EAF02_004801 [Botrytis sinoallii]
MPMKLEGSCQCGLVEFSLQSQTPVPYQLCACSICRKCGGYGGCVNLGGIASTLEITKGKEHIKKYTATADRGKPTAKKCTSERNFCSECASMLWLWDKTWPELIHPFASAIDTELPIAEEMVCVKGDSKPEYVRWPEGKKKVYEGYGEFSIEEWHKEKGLWVA